MNHGAWTCVCITTVAAAVVTFGWAVRRSICINLNEEHQREFLTPLQLKRAVLLKLKSDADHVHKQFLAQIKSAEHAPDDKKKETQRQYEECITRIMLSIDDVSFQDLNPDTCTTEFQDVVSLKKRILREISIHGGGR